VKRNRLLRKASRADIEQTIKLWLRYACDRSGGRQLRQKKRIAVETDSD
jgi:hypothetical protein